MKKLNTNLLLQKTMQNFILEIDYFRAKLKALALNKKIAYITQFLSSTFDDLASFKVKYKAFLSKKSNSISLALKEVENTLSKNEKAVYLGIITTSPSESGSGPIPFVCLILFILAYILHLRANRDDLGMDNSSKIDKFFFFSKHVLQNFFVDMFKKKNYWFETKYYLFFLLFTFALSLLRSWWLLYTQDLNLFFFFLVLTLIPFVLVRASINVFRNILYLKMLFKILKDDSLKKDIEEYILLIYILTIDCEESSKKTKKILKRVEKNWYHRLVRELIVGSQIQKHFIENNFTFLVKNMKKYIILEIIIKLFVTLLYIMLQTFVIKAFIFNLPSVISFFGL